MHPRKVLLSAAESFLVRSTAGDFAGARALERALAADGSPVVRAFACAVRSQIGLAFPEEAALPSEPELARFAGEEDDARRAAARAARDLVLAALLELDGKALARRADLLARLASDERGALDVALAGAWCALLADRPPPADFEAIAGRASKAGHARALIEAQVQRALFALAAGDHAAGLELSRRGSLMARTENIPQAEFLANLTLARARRYNRQAHLALRVVTALRAVVTARWQGWLAWESLFLGAGGGSAEESPAGALALVMKAAELGQRGRFERGVAELAARLGDGLFAREARDLAAVIAPGVAPASAEIGAWRAGETDLVPAAIHGAAPHLDGEDGAEQAAAYVLVRPGERGARFLSLGLPLLPESDVTRMRKAQRALGRVETLLAILALAGAEGLPEADCFRRAYGFPYVPALHRGVFDVLIHRARAVAGSIAEIERGGGVLTLRVARPLAIPDPRISQRTTDRVLRLLAKRGAATAKEAASDLKLSLRAVQGALNELAKIDACAVQRDGRHVAYVVEDTVFSEPTLRLHTDQLTGALDWSAIS